MPDGRRRRSSARCRRRGRRRRSAGRSGRRRRSGETPRAARPSMVRTKLPPSPITQVVRTRCAASTSARRSPRRPSLPVRAQRAQRRVLGDRPGGVPSNTYSLEMCTSVMPCALAAAARCATASALAARPRPGARRRLGRVDRGGGGGVDHDVDAGPVVRRDGRGVGDVEVGAVEGDGVGQHRGQRPAELAAGADDRDGHGWQVGVPGLAGVPGGEQPVGAGLGERGCRGVLVGQDRRRARRPGQAQLGVQRVTRRARRPGGSGSSTGRSSPCRRRARRTRARGPRPGTPRGTTRRPARPPRPARTSATPPGRRRSRRAARRAGSRRIWPGRAGRRRSARRGSPRARRRSGWPGRRQVETQRLAERRRPGTARRTRPAASGKTCGLEHPGAGDRQLGGLHRHRTRPGLERLPPVAVLAVPRTVAASPSSNGTCGA